MWSVLLPRLKWPDQFQARFRQISTIQPLPYFYCHFKSKGKLSTAIDDGWIDNSTRAVVVDMVLYCNPSRIFTSVQLVAEIPPIGNIYTGNSEVRSFPEIEYESIGHYALLGVRSGSIDHFQDRRTGDGPGIPFREYFMVWLRRI